MSSFDDTQCRRITGEEKNVTLSRCLRRTISLRNRRGGGERDGDRSLARSRGVTSRSPSPSPFSCLKQQSHGRRPLWTRRTSERASERAKERRQGLGWLAFKVALQSAKPGSIPAPTILRPSPLSLSVSLSLCRSLFRRERTRLFSPPPPHPRFLSLSLSISVSYARCGLSRDVVRLSRDPRPRMQHRFSHKNSPRSTLSLGYYFLPGPLNVGERRSAPGILCSVNARRWKTSGPSGIARARAGARGTRKRASVSAPASEMAIIRALAAPCACELS